MNICNIQNILSLDAHSSHLAHQFCLCPQAKNLMEASAALTRVYLEVSPSFVSARTLFSYDSAHASLLEAHVEIPPFKNLNNSLSTLAHELLNVAHYPDLQPIYFRAMRGDLGMDAYAASLELEEDSSVLAHDRLMQQCAPSWQIVWDGKKNRMEDLQQRLWDSELSCHTDMLRRRWISQHQTAFCEQHPDDLRSCATKPEDLCDFALLKTLSAEQQNYIYFLRTCARLPTAPAHLQKIFASIASLCERISDKPLIGS